MGNESDQFKVKKHLNKLFEMQNFYLDQLDTLKTKKEFVLKSYDNRIAGVNETLSEIQGQIQDALDELDREIESESDNPSQM